MSLPTVPLDQKRVWRLADLAAYSGWGQAYIYKLVMLGKVPGVSKPNGKTLFFDSQIVIPWLLSNPLKTHEEIDQKAATYVALNP
ncbi:DNA-binding protein [Cytophagaceae bacterium YF14B1]|uniref:DNA-binding protein n=1 Tax=Xanthocytophaga flava TaxID=3048013 RepID=A0AAE3QSI7_9BACT|nr:DNA-binding protein [Xanthocytophaga flavus]MDJ1481883.1 DNA-binding protein [Xanthocytophaga flavus]